MWSKLYLGVIDERIQIVTGIYSKSQHYSMKKNIKNSSIVVNKQELKRRYNEYNSLYFGGRLGKCALSYNYITAFGRYIYDQKGKSTIIISKNVRWTDEALSDVLIHEMLHMYLGTVLHIRFDGLFGHGPIFKLMCLRLRLKYGLNTKVHYFEYGYLREGRPLSRREKFWMVILGC